MACLFCLLELFCAKIFSVSTHPPTLTNVACPSLGHVTSLKWLKACGDTCFSSYCIISWILGDKIRSHSTSPGCGSGQAGSVWLWCLGADQIVAPNLFHVFWSKPWFLLPHFLCRQASRLHPAGHLCQRSWQGFIELPNATFIQPHKSNKYLTILQIRF